MGVERRETKCLWNILSKRPCKTKAALNAGERMFFAFYPGVLEEESGPSGSHETSFRCHMHWCDSLTSLELLLIYTGISENRIRLLRVFIVPGPDSPLSCTLWIPVTPAWGGCERSLLWSGSIAHSLQWWEWLHEMNSSGESDLWIVYHLPSNSDLHLAYTWLKGSVAGVEESSDAAKPVSMPTSFHSTPTFPQNKKVVSVFPYTLACSWGYGQSKSGTN